MEEPPYQPPAPIASATSKGVNASIRLLNETKEGEYMRLCGKR